MDDIVTRHVNPEEQEVVNDVINRLIQWSLITFPPPTSFDLPDDLIDAADLIATQQAGIEGLRAAIDAFIADVDSDHQPEWMDQGAEARGLAPIWCVKCGAADGGWPCNDRMALDQLKEACRD